MRGGRTLRHFANLVARQVDHFAGEAGRRSTQQRAEAAELGDTVAGAVPWRLDDPQAEPFGIGPADTGRVLTEGGARAAGPVERGDRHPRARLVDPVSLPPEFAEQRGQLGPEGRRYRLLTV